MIMGYKTLSVSDEVYELLCAMKDENESFNDLFTRLIRGNGKHILKFYGQLSNSSDFDSVMARIANDRKKEQDRL
ncbi:MAG: antitoxin VapB family protein [Asgard group archaeon]|nr:antitoxin VapB family protein [Asgard group archaeon]